MIYIVNSWKSPPHRLRCRVSYPQLNALMYQVILKEEMKKHEKWSGKGKDKMK